MSKELRVCEVCGKKFLSSHKNHSICSDECRNKKNAANQLRRYREKNNKPQAKVVYHKQGAILKNCMTCGKEFETYDEGKEFCSLTCRKAKALNMTVEEYEEYRQTKGRSCEEALPISKESILVAYITYGCYKCKKKTKVYLEEGVEVDEDSKPAPFELICPNCGGVMREVDSWRPLKKSRKNKPGEKYLASFPEGDVSVYVYSNNEREAD